MTLSRRTFTRLSGAAAAGLVLPGHTPAAGQDNRPILRFAANASDVFNLDPHFSTTYQDWMIRDMLFNGLIRYTPGDSSSLEPDIAREMPTATINADGTQTWTFLLRDDVICHPTATTEAYPLTSADVVFSAVPSWGFLWRPASDGRGLEGVNHDAAHRPRRQDRPPEYLETGAFYVLDAHGYRAARHRFFGVVTAHLVAEPTAIEIDTPEQLLIASAIASEFDRGAPVDADAVVTDFDGVHTDDRVLLGEDGSEYVTVNRSDGMGVARLVRAGIPVLILSTERNRVVAARARKLGIEVRHGLDDKAAALREWATDAGIPLDRVAYLGNDINDLGCLDLVGWPVATADAHPLVRAAARVVLDRRGGDGAVRALADRVLAAHDDSPTQRPREEARA